MSKPEFSLQDIISGIQSATVTTEIYPDTSTAVEVMELKAQLDMLKESGLEEPRSIADEPIEVRLRNKIEEIRGRRIEFTLRALSQAELEVTKKRVAHEYPVPKGLSHDERLEAEHEQSMILYTYLISLAIRKVKNYANDSETTSMSREDVNSLYAVLPSAEWTNLVKGFDAAQGSGHVLRESMSDPSFRGDGAVED